MTTTITAPVKTDVVQVNWTRNTALVAKIAERNRLKAVEAAGKAAEVARKALDDELFAALDAEGATEVIVNGQTVVKVQGSSNSKIDPKLLAQLFPAAVAPCTVKTPYRFLKTL